MISSVIARLNKDYADLETTVNEIAAHPDLDVGELIDNRMLPVTLDASGNQETEAITRWLQSREGVEFVDVVFVHFDDK